MVIRPQQMLSNEATLVNLRGWRWRWWIGGHETGEVRGVNNSMLYEVLGLIVLQSNISTKDTGHHDLIASKHSSCNNAKVLASVWARTKKENKCQGPVYVVSFCFQLC